MKASVAALMGGLAIAASAGPLSKFEERAPVAEFQSSAKMEDIERCLIDVDGWLAPRVYRQPDRPDEVSLVWIGPNGMATGKVELKRSSTATLIKTWMPAKQVRSCAAQR